MINKKTELEQFLTEELKKSGQTYEQIQVVEYEDNNEANPEQVRYVHIVINIVDDWDYRQLCEVSFLDGELHYVSGTINGGTIRLLQRWVEKENE